MRKCGELNDERIRTILGNVDVLSRPEIRDLESLLRSLNSVDHYRAPLVAKGYGKATVNDCARSAAKSLEAAEPDGCGHAPAASRSDPRVDPCRQTPSTSGAAEYRDAVERRS